MIKITVLGAGMVGSAIAVDLSDRYQVSVADISDESLNKLNRFSIQTIQTDLTEPENIQKVIKEADLVVNAVPGHLGYKTLRTIIETGKNVVDIAFFSEDPFTLDALAKKNRVTAVVDCGVAPGMSNMILGRHNKDMTIESFCCMVGGLPLHPEWPFQYKAPFSPADVLEEYTRPARLVEKGRVVVKSALSDIELVDIKPAGQLEAFNTDGLRTLIDTMKIPEMKEKTLRYPGHIELMKIFRETGFLDKEPLTLNKTTVIPLDITSKLLFPLWKLGEEEAEFTIMTITMTGQKEGKPLNLAYFLYDEYDKTTKTASMSRTTGYACTAVADLVIKNRYAHKGISPPEFIGADSDCFRYVLEYQKERGIQYRMEEISG